MGAVSSFGETYEEMLTRYERTAAKLATDLAAQMTASNKSPDLVLTPEWREHVRDFAHVMVTFPDLILSHPPPEYLGTLYRMYEQWASPYVQRARYLLDAVAAAEAGDLPRYARTMQDVARLSEVVAALSEARSVYISGALAKKA
jgi:hypothetical protein